MNALRDEVVESQKIRADFLKWKLVLVAGLGAAGLGLNEIDYLGSTQLLLALIPFVCVYVDVVCRHQNLRIELIGHFIRSVSAKNSSDRLAAYERYCQEHRSAFALETWILKWSTIVLSILIMITGLLFELRSLEPDQTGRSLLPMIVFVIAEVSGIALGEMVEQRYHQELAKLESPDLE